MATSDDDPSLDDSVLAEVAHGLSAPAVEAWSPAVAPEDRYQLGEVLGTGGMATVHSATDTVLGRVVALKFVRDDNLVLVARLQREARAQARIEHPNICRVYDVGQLGGVPFIAMQRIDGRPLGAVAPELTVPERVRIVRDVARAVHAAHATGLVHRDLKPANVLVDAEGKPYVMDFGIAREAAEPTLTMTGQVIGTPQYMAPEQAAGQTGDVDARTDVYALGVTLYELLCGKPPFEAPTLAELIARITTADPIPLRRRAPELPPALETVVMHCLHKRRDARYPTAQALADELDRVLDGAPIKARPPGVAARVVVAARRHRVGVALALAAVATAAAIVLGVRAGGHRGPAWRPVIRELAPVLDENAGSVAISPDGRTIAYDSDRDGTFRIYVAPIGGGTDRAITSSDRYASSPSFSADGSTLIYARAEGIYRQRVDGGPETKILDAASVAVECGVRLVYYRARPTNALWVQDAGGAERELARLPDGHFVRGLRCDRAGRRAVYADRSPGGVSAPGTINLIDLGSSRGPIVVVSEHDGSDFPSFHPDGKSILFTSARGGARNLWEQPIAGGPPTQITFGGGPDVSAAVTPDGRALIYNVDQTWIPVYAQPLAGGPPRRVTTTLEDVNTLDVSPEGTELVLGVRRNGVEQIALLSLADGQERVIADGRTPIFTAEGRDVVFVRGTQLVAVARTGGPGRTLADLPGPIVSPVKAADGIYFAARVDGRLAGWRVPLAGGAAELVAAPTPCQGTVPLAHGWTACWSAATGIDLVPTGAKPGDPRVISIGGAPPSLPHPSALVYPRDGDLHRIDLATGADTPLFHIGDRPIQFWGALSPDGTTLYYSEVHGMVRRQVITNFGDRPRPRR